MKRPLQILLKISAVLVSLIVIFLVIVFVVDQISSKLEDGRIQPYGQYVEVDGKNMNVLIQGEGEETVVLLPGLGTGTPALDFKPLVEELAPFYKVVVIEPFGYGLSDVTKKERNLENIVDEIHEALQQLQINRYILMGHSIAGIYGLDYVNKYEHEVSAFVGIDSSAPKQYGGKEIESPISPTTISLLKKSGLARLIMKLSADPYAAIPVDDETKEQMRILSYKNFRNISIANEIESMFPNLKAAENLTFPQKLPVVFFLQPDKTAIEGWAALHEEQVKDSDHSKVMTFEGTHYLHHTRSKEIVENFRIFMRDVLKENK
ncbi:pimeloyl-ACP methyl ester carboxylesterase [Paenibacillus amylolyticus]|uniref:Pimeloyl-ACP methyl ester carboxylesterase n=1 Tax=Paenibacillus amylolyticus TaxID=1451 RepID=A0AAP5H0A7_PAEAM|nr:alpha/beta hydrolase [Paenibacillus amylolyticus]MDR6721576.1 pimeloyl-ACP methyl ester carboxylesterase [Paenibacillus amylolyticus]